MPVALFERASRRPGGRNSPTLAVRAVLPRSVHRSLPVRGERPPEPVGGKPVRELLDVGRRQSVRVVRFADLDSLWHGEPPPAREGVFLVVRGPPQYLVDPVASSAAADPSFLHYPALRVDDHHVYVDGDSALQVD